jgi:hypothetical protein
VFAAGLRAACEGEEKKGEAEAREQQQAHRQVPPEQRFLTRRIAHAGPPLADRGLYLPIITVPQHWHVDMCRT